MGWSTTVISPPDGHMSSYINSLKKLLQFSFDICWPTHGPSIKNLNSFIESIIDHRIKREKQILALLGSKNYIYQIVEELYKDKDPILYPDAGQSVLAHLIHLIEQGLVISDEVVDVNSKFNLA